MAETDPNVTSPAEPVIPEAYKGKSFADMIKIVEDTKRFAEDQRKQAEAKAQAAASTGAEQQVKTAQDAIIAKAAAVAEEFAKTGILSEASLAAAKELKMDSLISKYNEQQTMLLKHEQDKVVETLASKLGAPQEMVRKTFEKIDRDVLDPKEKDLIMKSIRAGKTALFQEYIDDYVVSQTQAVKGTFSAPVVQSGFQNPKDVTEMAARAMTDPAAWKKFQETSEKTPWFQDYTAKRLAELEASKRRREQGSFGT